MPAFVIYKKEKQWVIESKEDSKLEKSTHTSLIRGLRAFFNRHPGIQLFYLVIPEADSKVADITEA